MTEAAFTEVLAARVHQLKQERERMRWQRDKQRKRAELWKHRYQVLRQAKEKRR